MSHRNTRKHSSRSFTNSAPCSAARGGRGSRRAETENASSPFWLGGSLALPSGASHVTLRFFAAHQQQLRRHPLECSAAIHTSQRAMPSTKQRPLAKELVLVFELRLGCRRNRRSQRQHIVKSCRHAIPAIELRDDEEQAPLLHRSIVTPLSAKQLRPTDLEVREIIRVMQEAHRIGFGVSHSELSLVLSHVASI